MKNTEVRIISFFDERESRINLFNLFFCLRRISDVWISEICSSNILIFCRDLVWTYSMCLRGHKIWLNLQFGIYSRWSYNDILKLWWHQRYWRSTPVVLVHWLIAKFFFCGEHFLVTCFMCVKKGWKGCIKICTQQDAYFWTKVWCDQNKPESCLTHCILADFQNSFHDIE